MVRLLHCRKKRQILITSCIFCYSSSLWSSRYSCSLYFPHVEPVTPTTPKHSQELLYFDHANQLTNELEFLPLKWNVFQPHYFSWNFSLNPWSSLHVPVSVFHGGVEKNRPGEIIRGWNVPRDPLKGHVIVYSAALKYFSWKKSIYTKQHHKVAFEQLWKKTSLQISNYGAFAQAGPVACWCFYGHLARTEIAVLGPWRRGIVQVYIWSSRNKF